MVKKRCKDWVPGGRASGRCAEEFDPEQVRRGIEVEMEHVVGGPYDEHTARMMARDIAQDHLVEDRAYYTKLATIHEEAPSYTKNARRRPTTKRDPDAELRRFRRDVFSHFPNGLGGDGWDDWSVDEIDAVMENWVIHSDIERMGGDSFEMFKDLLEDGFDPRDVRERARETLRLSPLAKEEDDRGGFRPNRRRVRVYDALEMAANMRATFQGKAAEQAIEFPFDWPNVVQHVGESLAVAYESDKWKKKGNFEAYKHLAESENHALCVPGLIHRYEDASESYRVVGPRVSLASAPMPRHFAILGLFVEADLRLHVAGTNDEPEFGEEEDAGCVKLTVGHGMLGASKILWSRTGQRKRDQPFLFVYTEKDGVLMVIVGKTLDVEKDGITG